jgi:hypothetical protein
MECLNDAQWRATPRTDRTLIPRINVMLFPLDHSVVGGRELSRLEQVHLQRTPVTDPYLSRQSATLAAPVQSNRMESGGSHLLRTISAKWDPKR